MGPEGGVKGGKIIAEGNQKKLLKSKIATQVQFKTPFELIYH